MVPSEMSAISGQTLILWRAAIGATIATPLTIGAFSLVVFPIWTALTFFGWFTMALPSLISSLVVVGVCHVMARPKRIAAWWSYLLVGIAVGFGSAMLWTIALASSQDWQLSFGFGDPAPGSPAPDAASEALQAVSFLGTTGTVLGAWTALIFWLIRRPDRDAANPPTPTP